MTRAVRLGALAVLATAGLAIVAAAPAAATDVTANQFSSLAASASAGNAAAIAQLRAVTAIDGRRVSLALALSDADSSQTIARLKALAAPRVGEPTLISDSGARAATILRDLGYKPPPSTATSSTQSGGSGGLPGPAWLWLALGALVVVISSVAASRALSRLEPAVREAPRGDDASDDRATRASLERDAKAAEARGAFSEAVRLRFRAGLLGLARQSGIDGRPSLRNAEISREIHSPEFDRIAGTFERVAYGGEPASADDANEAREGWPRVLSETPR
jgi:hypothetical protein